MEAVLTGSIAGLFAGTILLAIGWLKEHIDHRCIRKMEVRYVQDTLNEYIERRKQAPLTASEIYNNPAYVPLFASLSEQDVEIQFRFIFFKTLHKMLEGNANQYSTFTALERWKIESTFIDRDHLWDNREKSLRNMCRHNLDLSTAKELIQFANDMPGTKGKALKSEQKTASQNK